MRIPTLNDYLIDYRVSSMYVIHVTRIVVVVRSLERSDCHVSVFRYLQAAIPRLNGPEVSQPLSLWSGLPNRHTRQFDERPPWSFDQTPKRDDFRRNYCRAKNIPIIIKPNVKVCVSMLLRFFHYWGRVDNLLGKRKLRI